MSASLEALNRQFGIPNAVQVLAGRGGLPKIHIASPVAQAELYLHGAHLTSWQPDEGDEVLFLSDRSLWEDGQPIRGGIPICFPWFRARQDDPQAPRHGFARICSWQLDSVDHHPDGSVTVALSTAASDFSRRWWPYDFRLSYRLRIGRTLQLELIVANTGREPFRFEEALHTYFHVGLAQRVQVRGLDGVAYLDNTDANRRKVQSGALLFSGATDNAYIDTQSPVELVDPVLRRSLTTAKENSASTVVWNPGREGAASIPDLGEEEWQRMACIEASNALICAVTLAPGNEHRMAATLTVARLPAAVV
ncbi:MAG TPA: D-hexose-6-phosphate mutarotase [Acidobacteriaceae bacterium]|jgi:glucose-6-phosphate 1-epimerase|nr:D-hexose-6-phosphate mutarotase [Acidobacteriaceae bacterium]